jgi:hypothetical protein
LRERARGATVGETLETDETQQSELTTAGLSHREDVAGAAAEVLTIGAQQGEKASHVYLRSRIHA